MLEILKSKCEDKMVDPMIIHYIVDVYVNVNHHPSHAIMHWCRNVTWVGCGSSKANLLTSYLWPVLRGACHRSKAAAQIPIVGRRGYLEKWRPCWASKLVFYSKSFRSRWSEIVLKHSKAARHHRDNWCKVHLTLQAVCQMICVECLMTIQFSDELIL